jgi:hypothetical protein
MQGADKSPAEVATGTVEKILMGVQDPTFMEYAKRAIAILKMGVAMAQKQGPESKGMQAPPGPGAGAPQMPSPPVPGPMPG